MKPLNFPEYQFRFKSKENKTAIFSILRKKFLILTPEEWVRQHCVKFLISEKNYSETLLNEEKQIKLNGIDKRYDIVAFKPNGDIRLVVECKAPNVKINQNTFDQIARYNMALNAEFLMVTNGVFHYYCKLDYVNKMYHFLPELPNLKK